MSLAKINQRIKKFIENLTEYVGVIDSDHAYIHNGIGFVLTGSTTIANAGTYKIKFTTPDITDNDVIKSKQRYVHWRPSAITGLSGGITWVLYEESTTISGGSSGTILNLNRNSIKTSNMTAIIGVTVGSDGTQIQIGGSGTAGNVARGAGGTSGAAQERVLKPNTDYTLTITNLYAGNNVTSYELFWYEENEGHDTE